MTKKSESRLKRDQATAQQIAGASTRVVKVDETGKAITPAPIAQVSIPPSAVERMQKSFHAKHSIVGKAVQKQTQKSAAEQFLATNKSWDEIKKLEENCLMLILANADLGRLINDRNILRHMPDQVRVTQLVRMLVTDLNTFKIDLNQLQATYGARAGAATDENDLMLSITAAEEYSMWTMRYAEIITPVYNEVLEAAAVAEQSLAKEVAELERARLSQEAQNTSVVTDLEVKEPATETPAVDPAVQQPTQ
jgi:hypothetical protein